MPLQAPRDCGERSALLGAAADRRLRRVRAAGRSVPPRRRRAGTASAHTATIVRRTTATMAQRSERVVRDIIPPLVVTGYDGSEGRTPRTLADLLQGLTSRLPRRLPCRAALFAPSDDGLADPFPFSRAPPACARHGLGGPSMRVQLAGVGKHFGAHVILDRVTLTIGPKARIGLVGPNGVGKTTLLRIVAGQEQPDAGTVTRAPYATDGRLSRAGADGAGRRLRARLARTAHGVDGRRAGARRIGTRSGRQGNLPPTVTRMPSIASFRSAPRASSRAPVRPVPSSGSASISTASSPASRAGSPRASHSPRSCSRASTCCSSTSRRTTSTSRGSNGSSSFSAGIAARSSSSRTTASSSTEPSTALPRSSRTRGACASGREAGATTRRRGTPNAPPRSPSSSRRSCGASSSRRS